MQLYYHKTDGGAEYLTDKFIEWEHNGKKGKEGIFEGAKYIVRLDGDITKDAELNIRDDEEKKNALLVRNAKEIMCNLLNDLQDAELNIRDDEEKKNALLVRNAKEIICNLLNDLQDAESLIQTVEENNSKFYTQNQNVTMADQWLKLHDDEYEKMEELDLLID